jgi:hypothetical protein
MHNRQKKAFPPLKNPPSLKKRTGKGIIKRPLNVFDTTGELMEFLL